MNMLSRALTTTTTTITNNTALQEYIYIGIKTDYVRKRDP